jgi:hypothetical protein
VSKETYSTLYVTKSTREDSMQFDRDGWVVMHSTADGLYWTPVSKPQATQAEAEKLAETLRNKQTKPFRKYHAQHLETGNVYTRTIDTVEDFYELLRTHSVSTIYELLNRWNQQNGWKYWL